MDLELQAEGSKDVISLYTTSLLRFRNDISPILGMIREHPLHTILSVYHLQLLLNPD